MHPRQSGQTYVFDCADGDTSFSFTIKNGPGEIALWLPRRFARPYMVLGQVRAASGSKFVDDGVMVWTKGDDAMLEIDDTTWSGCRHDRRRSIWEHAKLSGVDFRAVGNEPGWHLELRRGQHISFVYDYGQQVVRTPWAAPTVDTAAGQTIYHVETGAHRLKLTLEAGPCADTMSDETFETRVTVDLDGTLYAGCGRALH